MSRLELASDRLKTALDSLDSLDSDQDSPAAALGTHSGLDAEQEDSRALAL